MRTMERLYQRVERLQRTRPRLARAGLSLLRPLRNECGHYGNESRQGLIYFDATWIAPIAFQTPADKAFAKILAAVTILRVGVYVTTAMTVTVPVVDFDRRITPGSDTGRVGSSPARLTFPSPVGTAAIGTVIYKNCQVDLNAGDEVVFELVTAATAGGGIPFMEYVARHTAPTDNADMVAGS